MPKPVSLDRRCDSVMITSKSFILTAATLEFLRHPPKFSPTPSKRCHEAIKWSVRDFSRKLKWRSLLSNRPSFCRFPHHTKSSAFPPHGCVSPSLLRGCRFLESAVNCCLSPCSQCFLPSNLSTNEQRELQQLRDDSPVTVLPAEKGGGMDDPIELNNYNL